MFSCVKMVDNWTHPNLMAHMINKPQWQTRVKHFTIYGPQGQQLWQGEVGVVVEMGGGGGAGKFLESLGGCKNV